MTTKTPEYFIEEISTVAAAEKYSMTPSYVARLARTHIIRARKFGRDWIIDEVALRNYLSQPRKPGPKSGRTSSKQTQSIPKGEGDHNAGTKGDENGKAVPKQRKGVH